MVLQASDHRDFHLAAAKKGYFVGQKTQEVSYA